MLNSEKLQEAVKNNNYMINFDEQFKEAYLIKHKGDVRISAQRAIAWVEAGIKDLDCRTKEEMLEMLKSWL